MDIYEKIIKSGFGEKIIKAIHTNIDNDVNELINYLDEESKEYCTKDLREKYAKILRELIDDIYNSNQEMIKILINEKICESGIDIEIVNRRRLLLKKLNECFVYGAYSGRFFYDMYWIYVKSRKSDEAVIIKRRSPFLEPSNTGINFSIEEDNIGLRKKRRAEDIKKLRQMFSYYIDKSSAERVTESDEFNDLWDIVDCYIFKYEEISHNIVTSAKENSRKKTVLNFWRLFGQTEGVERKYVFKKGMPLDLLNNERNGG